GAYTEAARARGDLGWPIDVWRCSGLRFGTSMFRTSPAVLAVQREGESRHASRAPALIKLTLAALREPPGVAEVRVPFQEGDPVYLVRVRPHVAQHVEAVADVDHVDQTVADDREAP